ncbi:MAG: hypothetical protein H0W40_19330 [Methylibium sp.]|uniref:hypothetical protein n=1 Tax=Methylibium sp. TaxID=2067992 RepID=UPI00183C5807|nr:hypothetical protein [Methylibium sp.]MBA3599498.1 hypothetical protein [Methylibium sp.]
MTCQGCADDDSVYELGCPACCRRFYKNLKPTYGKRWLLEHLASFAPADIAEKCSDELKGMA